jgi:hypothetical protein
MPSRRMVIDHKFRGPDNSGNGGYVCGRLARLLPGSGTVRLNKPPPLDTPMEIRDCEQGVELLAGEERVALAWTAGLSVDVPEPPNPDEVTKARPFFLDENYAYPRGCFVCGPERAVGDGMRIFPGLVAARDMVAAAWLPHDSLSDGSGAVEPHFVWSALDCPGGMSFVPEPGNTAVLGQLAAEQLAAIKLDENYTVIAWEVERAGRKHVTGSAIFDSTSQCVAIALGTWIEIRLPSQR